MVLSIMDVPHLDLFIDEYSLVEGAQKIFSILRPDWDASTIQYKVFADGITNKLIGGFRYSNENEVILVRVYGNKTGMLIDRKAETKNIKILNSVGLAPQLYATFDNGLVYEYVPGEVLTQETCRMENIATLVAKKLADMHSMNLGSCIEEPAMWKHIKKFLSLVPTSFSNQVNRRRYIELFQGKLNLEKEFSFLEEFLLNLDSKMVFCHNDLLLGNVIYNSKNNRVTFIDYEYADYNYQAYDIANHFNEYAGVENADYTLFPHEDYQKRWLKIYLGKFKGNLEGCEEVEVNSSEVESLYSLVQKFTLASHYLWGVWCLVQAEHSLIDFDFMNYAFVRFEEYFRRKKKFFN